MDTISLILSGFAKSVNLLGFDHDVLVLPLDVHVEWRAHQALGEIVQVKAVGSMGKPVQTCQVCPLDLTGLCVAK